VTTLPTIDLRQLSPGAGSRDTALAELRATVASVGAFYLVGHEVPIALYKNLRSRVVSRDSTVSTINRARCFAGNQSCKLGDMSIGVSRSLERKCPSTLKS
jgi:hypothetical protein